ncbi:MAG: RNA 2'-phosphotransferase, partial [Nostoc sp.]
AIGIQLAPGGWVAVDELLIACARNEFAIARHELQVVVESNDKQRFSFDSTGTLIRANQGHSIKVDLQLEPIVPPDELYHGTGRKSVESILQTGLGKISRNHV